jgi:hypothetical protein
MLSQIRQRQAQQLANRYAENTLEESPVRVVSQR